METFLEVLKYTIPALVVFLTSYFILKQYLRNNYNMKALELKAKYSQDAIPLKLQAYERLLLFCERISIPNLLMRLNSKEMTNGSLKNALIISIQKEYEHNMAQQLYASNNLWEIITLAKNEMINLVMRSSEGLSDLQSSDQLSKRLFEELNKLDKNPVGLAVRAVKEEAKIILDV